MDLNDKSPEKSNFRKWFKYYKRRESQPDFSNVLDLRVSNAALGISCLPLRTDSISEKIKEAIESSRDFIPLTEWNLTTFDDRPGFYLLNGILNRRAQLKWLQRTLFVYPEPPNVTNLSMLRLHTGRDVFKRVGEKLRWVTMGNDYNWDIKEYARSPRASLPEEIVQLARVVVRVLGLGEMDADAVILNYYPEKATLSPHVDRYDSPSLSSCLML